MKMKHKNKLDYKFYRILWITCNNLSRYFGKKVIKSINKYQDL
jgi:hypothetical protein